MGPFASARLLELILNIAKKRFGAEAGDEFPEIVLLSLPVKEFFGDKKEADAALRFLRSRVKTLENHDAIAFGIACNTAHIFTDRIREATKIELVSIIESTANKVKEKGFKRVGLLASPVTLSSKLYEAKLQEAGIRVLLPNKGQVRELGNIISELVSNKNAAENRLILGKMAESFEKRGAEAIILGCTELPLAFPKRFNLPVFNTLEILANALLERCYLEEKHLKKMLY